MNEFPPVGSKVIMTFSGREKISGVYQQGGLFVADKPFSGLHDASGRVPWGHGWFVTPDMLELVEKFRPKITGFAKFIKKIEG